MQVIGASDRVVEVDLHGLDEEDSAQNDHSGVVRETCSRLNRALQTVERQCDQEEVEQDRHPSSAVGCDGNRLRMTGLFRIPVDHDCDGHGRSHNQEPGNELKGHDQAQVTPGLESVDGHCKTSVQSVVIDLVMVTNLKNSLGVRARLTASERI